MVFLSEAALITKTSAVSFNSISVGFKEGLWPFRKLAHLDSEATVILNLPSPEWRRARALLLTSTGCLSVGRTRAAGTRGRSIPEPWVCLCWYLNFPAEFMNYLYYYVIFFFWNIFSIITDSKIVERGAVDLSSFQWQDLNNSGMISEVGKGHHTMQLIML